MSVYRSRDASSAIGGEGIVKIDGADVQVSLIEEGIKDVGIEFAEGVVRCSRSRPAGKRSAVASQVHIFSETSMLSESI